MTRWISRCIGGLRGFWHDGRIDLGGSGSVVELLVSYDHGDGILDDVLQILGIVGEIFAIEILGKASTGGFIGESEELQIGSRHGADDAT